MGDSLAGTRLIKDASLMADAVEKMGGVSILTEKELQKLGGQANEAAEKMKKLGLGVPANLQAIATAGKPVTSSLDSITGSVGKMAAAFGIGFSVGAVVNFGKALLSDADALVKLSDKTGVSLQGLQRFQIAGDDAGNSVDQLTGAITKMEDKLVSGDKSALSALNKLGVPFADIKNLSPENQFIAISDALRQMQDPAQQVAVAIDLFGKQGAEVLPTLKRGFDDVKNAAVGMSDETILALDEAGDVMAKLWRGVKVGSSEALVGLVHFAQDGFGMVGYEARKAAREVEEVNAEVKRMTDKLPPATKAVAGLLPPISIEAPRVQRALKELDGALDDLTKDSKKAADEHLKLWENLHRLEAVAPGVTTQIGRMDTELVPTIAHWVEFHEAVKRVETATPTKDLPKWIHEVGVESQVAKIEFEGFMGPLQDSLPAAHFLDGGLKDLADSMTQLAQVSGDTFGGILQDIGQIVIGFELARRSVQQYQDATNNSQRAVALVGMGTGFAAATNTGNKWSSAAGGAAAGAAIGSMPALAAATGGASIGIGAGVGALVGWFRGRNARKEEKEVGDLRNAFIDAAGGLARLDLQAHNAGKTLDHLFQSKSSAQFTASIDELNRAFDLQATALDKVNETAQKWNINAALMGPAWDKQQLDKKAQELFQDWSVLHGAGIDQVEITQKMSKEVSDYFNKAIKMGIEIPKSMQPMLQNFADMGDLIDENGNAIRDLTDIKFAETMSEGFDRVVKAVGDLVDAITRGLNPTLLSIPDIDTTVTTHHRDEFDEETGHAGGRREFAATGGMVGQTGIQHFGMGGRVLNFPSRGTDTVPAMLTPGEMVLTAGQQKAVGALLRSGGAGGGGQSVVVQVDARSSVFENNAAIDRMAEKVGDVMIRKLNRSTRRSA